MTFLRFSVYEITELICFLYIMFNGKWIFCAPVYGRGTTTCPGFMPAAHGSEVPICLPDALCLLVRGGRGIGKSQTGAEMRVRSCVSSLPSLVSHCLLFEWQYAQFGPLYLCFTHAYTQTPLPPCTHTDEAKAALKALGTACLPVIVTAVCICVCVGLRKEILRVKCSPGLNYHFWVLSHHPTSQGLTVFLL